MEQVVLPQCGEQKQEEKPKSPEGRVQMTIFGLRLFTIFFKIYFNLLIVLSTLLKRLSKSLIIT
jgi:hypothetical protein